jgi:hypothetical protein
MELIQLQLETPERYKRRRANEAIDEIMGKEKVIYGQIKTIRADQHGDQRTVSGRSAVPG